eukprot:UN34191
MKHADSLDDKIWRLRERVYLAALDCGKKDIAMKLFTSLKQKFGTDSARIKCLQGLALEYMGQYDRALKQYAAILKEEPTHKMACNRRISCYIGQNK